MKDNEWAGKGNHYNYGARLSDPRTGRWLSIDPLAKETPWESPYVFVGNNPIEYFDVDGKFRMSDADCKLYPDLCNWINSKNGLIRLADNQLLQRVFKEYTQATTSQIKFDFQPGQGPNIHPDPTAWDGKGGDYTGDLNINAAFFEAYKNAKNDLDRLAAQYVIAAEIAHEEAHGLAAKYGDKVGKVIDETFNASLFESDIRNVSAYNFKASVTTSQKLQSAQKIISTFNIQSKGSIFEISKERESKKKTTPSSITTAPNVTGPVSNNTDKSPESNNGKESKGGIRQDKGKAEAAMGF